MGADSDPSREADRRGLLARLAAGTQDSSTLTPAESAELVGHGEHIVRVLHATSDIFEDLNAKKDDDLARILQTHGHDPVALAHASVEQAITHLRDVERVVDVAQAHLRGEPAP